MVGTVQVMGIDVGADRVHIVAIDRVSASSGAVAAPPTAERTAGCSAASGTVVAAWEVCAAWVLPPDLKAIGAVFAALAPTSIGIDGPDGRSEAPFRHDRSLAPKWRSARGCEVELGRQRGIWVSFATPTAELDGWMGVAASLFALARTHGHTPLETYPHGIYRTLAGTRLPKKTTAAGISARVAALERAGVTGRHLALWSHDALDAVAAALVAAHHQAGQASAIRCELDETTIWLPGQGAAHDPV